ncbi:MAG: GNAT family N-acetyltransferase [Mycobacteriales bacterium]
MSQLLNDFATYIRANAVVGRESFRIGAFTLAFHRDDDSPYLNYAVPDEDAEPRADDIAIIIKAFRARRRTPRMEYFPELSEHVEPALTAAGFVVDDILPVMTCTAQTLAAKPKPVGVRVRTPRTKADFLAVASVQHDAFGDPDPPGDEEVARLRDLVTVDGIVALGLLDDEPAGGGMCDTIHHGYGELAGVGVRRGKRGHGVGRALTHYLTARALEAGAETVFLTAATEPEQRLAAGVGYTPFATHVHVSLPS